MPTDTTYCSGVSQASPGSYPWGPEADPQESHSAVRVGSQASREEHTKKKEAGGKTGQKEKRACLTFTHFSHQCLHGNNSLHYPRKSPYPRDRDATTP